MLERAVLAVGVLLLVWLIGLAVRARIRHQTAAKKGTPVPATLAARLNLTAPGIVYFYGPHCTTCRRQASELDRLIGLAPVPVLRIDASREPHLVDELGVLTVPATVLVNASQHVLSINLGFRSADALREQLLAASVA